MRKHNSDYSRVLVPVRGSSADAHALKVVSRLIKPKEAEVTAVYVIEVALALPLDAELPEEIDRGEKVLEAAEVAARNFCESKADFITTDLLQARLAGAAIVDEAIERKCDLIVLTAGGENVHGKRSTPDTISYVLKNAPCEVMLLSLPTHNGDHSA